VTRREEEERREAVRDLVELGRPLAEAISAVRQFSWDSEAELVQLTRAAAVRVLTAYLEGTIGSSECHRWAEAVEGRDDIGFEDGHHELLSSFLFELATPELFEPMSPAPAHKWIERLSLDPAARHGSTLRIPGDPSQLDYRCGPGEER
jgi:hypothetical protein